MLLFHQTIINPKIYLNFIFILTLSPILSLDFKSQLHMFFLPTHHLFLNFYYFVYFFILLLLYYIIFFILFIITIIIILLLLLFYFSFYFLHFSLISPLTPLPTLTYPPITPRPSHTLFPLFGFFIIFFPLRFFF